MPDKKKPKREAPISYRPPKELRDEFRARVKKSGMSTSAFLTNAVFDVTAPRQSRRPSVEAGQLAMLLAQTTHIREKLYEIMMAGGDHGPNTLLLETACDDLEEIRAAILKLAVRKP